MLLENPFFIRELRAMSRRRFMPYATYLTLALLLLFLPVWLTDVRGGSIWDELRGRVPFALFVLLAGHTLACYATGWNLGVRVFAEEQRQNTLETLRLVSMSPLGWLLQKLALPIFGTLLVWLAPLPMYLCFALRAYPYAYPSTLEPPLMLALAAGVTGLSAGLLAPPEAARLRNLIPSRVRLSDLAANLSRTGLAPWIGIIIFNLGMDWLYGYFMRMPAFRTKPFFSTFLRTDIGLELLVGTYFAGALLSAWSTADLVNSLAARLANVGRNLAVLTAYVLFLGYSWPGSQTWNRVLMIGVPLVLAVSAYRAERKKRRRPEDPLAAREIAWLRRTLDNPVFIRDLLVTVRGSGLLRNAWGMWLRLVLITLALVGALLSVALAVRSVPTAATGSDLWELFKAVATMWTVIACLMLIPLMLGMGVQASRHWTTERKRDTLLQLIQSPLTAQRIVQGRWAAALVLSGVRTLPLLVMVLVGCTIMGWSGYMWGCFVAGVWFFSAGLIVSAGAAGPGSAVRRGLDPFSAQALAAYVVLGELVSFIGLLVSSYLMTELSVMVEYYWSTAAILNIILAWPIYLRAVADVERLRQTDLG